MATNPAVLSQFPSLVSLVFLRVLSQTVILCHDCTAIAFLLLYGFHLREWDNSDRLVLGSK